MQTTGNYGLKKPDGNEAVNIDDLNYNADVIDRKLKEVENKAGSIVLNASNIKTADGQSVETHLAENKTRIQTAQTTADNAKKRADEAFQAGVSTKADVVSILTSKKLQGLTTNSSWQDVKNTLTNMKLGKYDVGDIIDSSQLESRIEVWSYDNYFSNNIVIDASGNVYITNGSSIKKLNSNGIEIWSININSIRSIDIDNLGNVYVASSLSVKKINSNGIEVWFTNINGINNIAADSLGNVYVASSYNSSSYVKKINSSGSEVWSISDYAGTTTVVADNSGNVYVAINTYTSGKISIFNSSGGRIWDWVSNDGINTVVVDKLGNIYAMHASGEIQKINSSHTSLWVYNNQFIGSIAVDNTGNLYIATGGPIGIKKLNSSTGTEIPNHLYGYLTSSIAIDKSGYIYIPVDGKIKKLFGAARYAIIN